MPVNVAVCIHDISLGLCVSLVNNNRLWPLSAALQFTNLKTDSGCKISTTLLRL